LSVPIVSLPEAFVVRLSFAQASVDGLAASLGATEAVEGATDGAVDAAGLDDAGAPPPEHAATVRLASRTIVAGRARRMVNLDGAGTNEAGV
jgi:hypothetical protein